MNPASPSPKQPAAAAVEGNRRPRRTIQFHKANAANRDIDASCHRTYNKVITAHRLPTTRITTAVSIRPPLVLPPPDIAKAGFLEHCRPLQRQIEDALAAYTTYGPG